MRERSVLLLSGGLDSAANLAFCAERDTPALALTADYGQRAAKSEIRAARALCRYYGVDHEVVDLRWLGALGGSSLTDKNRKVPELASSQLDALGITRKTAAAVWVPNRNGVLINVASAYAETLKASRVVVGFNAEEAATFPDNSKAFLKQASRALQFSTANGVEVFSYTTDWDKSRIVRELCRLSKAFPLEKVWPCYFGGAKPCGKCESCRRFVRAVERAVGEAS